MIAALAMVDATTAVASVKTVRLASRVVADACAMYLASSPVFSGTSLSNLPHVCRDCAKLSAIVRRVNGH